MGIEPVDLAPDADPLGEPLCHPGPTPPPTDHARRSERHRRVFVLGFHPVGNPHGLSLKLHPAAPPVGDRDAAGPRCGDCAHRALLPGHRHPKCVQPPHAYAKPTGLPGDSRGRGVGVPAWWPGCADFTPGDGEGPTPGSPDAGPDAGSAAG